MTTSAIVILSICIAILAFILGYVIKGQKAKREKFHLDLQIKNLIKTYNTDTARLQDEARKLTDRNLTLSDKIRNIESDLLNYKTKYKSTKNDLERFMDAHNKCPHKDHCGKIEVKAPAKRGRKPKVK